MKTTGKINKIIGIVLSYVKPRWYWDFIGLKYSSSLRVYGNSFNMFGTEPWLIEIGDDVSITDGVKFITHDGGVLIYRDRNPKLEITKPIKIGSNTYIGTRTIILPGISIGENCIIGAGSVVTKDIPSNSVVAGNPARFIRSGNEYFEKVSKESLEVGDLSGEEKDRVLKKIYNYEE